MRLVGSTIRKNLRTTDIVARLGGDEFVILLPEIGPEQSEVAINKIQSKLLDVMRDNNWPVTFRLTVERAIPLGVGRRSVVCPEKAKCLVLVISVIENC